MFKFKLLDDYFGDIIKNADEYVNKYYNNNKYSEGELELLNMDLSEKKPELINVENIIASLKQ